MKYTIIRVNPAQIELVVDLFNKYRIFYQQPSDILLARQFINERLQHNESVIWVALAGNELPVGFTQLYPTYSSMRAVKNWILNDLYVEQAYRKQGIGEALIKTAMNFASENNATFVQLSTAVDNYTAQSLYEQIGFIKQAPEKDFYTYRIKVDNNDRI